MQFPVIVQDWCGHGYGEIFLPGSDIPDWFSYQCESPSLSFQMPPFQGCKLQGFTVCIVYSSKGDTKEPQLFPIVTMINNPNQSIFTHYAVTYENIPVTVEDHMWMFHLPPFMINKQLGSENPVELTVDLGGRLELKRLGVHFGNQICPHCRLSCSGDTLAYGRASRLTNTQTIDSQLDITESNYSQANMNTKRGLNDLEASPGQGPVEGQHSKRTRYDDTSNANMDQEE